MNDNEQRQRERAYQIWEQEGRQWHRAAKPDDLTDQQAEDVTKVNQDADKQFAQDDGAPNNAAEIRPPSTVAPD